MQAAALAGATLAAGFGGGGGGDGGGEGGGGRGEALRLAMEMAVAADGVSQVPQVPRLKRVLPAGTTPPTPPPTPPPAPLAPLTVGAAGAPLGGTHDTQGSGGLPALTLAVTLAVGEAPAGEGLTVATPAGEGEYGSTAPPVTAVADAAAAAATHVDGAMALKMTAALPLLALRVRTLALHEAIARAEGRTEAARKLAHSALAALKADGAAAAGSAPFGGPFTPLPFNRHLPRQLLQS
ncbi:hypothetical protein T492DRAFT_849821 [Pavlovales sp. CCMP2436]|nr:hypothetical protein T492DRAFT_849821 [Pavlovales sp. CCMP2436]